MKEFFIIFASGTSVALLISYCIRLIRLQSFKEIAERILQQAEKTASQIQTKAKEHSLELEKEQLEKSQQFYKEMRQKEEHFQKKMKELSDRSEQVEKKEKELKKKEAHLQRQSQENEALKIQLEHELEHKAQLSRAQAKEEILNNAAREAEKECKKIFFSQLQEIEDECEEKAKKIIISALGRCSQKQIPESSITTLLLPNEEIKAKIIGKEGKNIRAFEDLALVTLLIDDTPQTLFISCFDPLRRHIAKLTLIELIKDGRITPLKIDEELKRQREFLEKSLIQYGKEAADKALVYTLHPEILKLLGKLKFRSSLSQNVLDHSVEVSEIMGLIAAELQLNESLARRIGLLHDIGKALDATHGFSHAIAGMKFARNFGESESVANGIGCHHEEVSPNTMEAALCKPADTISAIRTGARYESKDQHLHKLTSLEEIAKSFDGVERAFALQAGREVRVFVKPDVIDESKAAFLAQSIANKIENTKNIPNKVQVTVIRETKATNY